MSKKVFNVFSILCFALVLCFIGCTELINPKTETDINLNIDLSKIIKSTRNTGETQSSASLGENPTIKVAIYDAKKYNATTNSTDNLDLITEAQAKIVNNEAKVKLNNIPVGIDAIVFAELSFSNGNSTEVMYAGNSEVFRVKLTDNKISLVLMKVEVDIEVKPDDSKPEEIINAKEPEIINQPKTFVKYNNESDNEPAKTYLTCTAKSIDGGNLSFKWWYKSEDCTNFEEFNSILEPSLNDDGAYTSSTMQIEVQKNDSVYFYCVVTNTNENATRNKVASVRSNTVQVACIEGTLSSISATYKSDSYELFGKTFNYNNVTVEETYTSGSDDNAKTITVIADERRYTISPNPDSENAIGYVPYTVTYNDSTLPSSPTASLTVPVKYELDANNLVLETYFNSSSVSVSDTENKINIPQYGTVKYSYQISDNDKISFIDKNGDNREIKDINSFNSDEQYFKATITSDGTNIANGDTCNVVGTYTYTVTLQSANEWFVCNSNKSKDFSVKVCPWEIILTLSESTSTVDPTNISLDTTYTLSISNDAYATSQNLPPATFSCLEYNNIISNDQLKIMDDNFTKGTIKASIKINEVEVEVASLEISRANTSVTYAEGLTCEVDSDGTVTLYISNADGLAIFRNIVNGSFTEKIIVQYKSNPNSTNEFNADNEYQNVNAVLESDITLSEDWTPIGVYSTTPTSAKPYSGTFDGNGKTITFENITHNSSVMYSSGLFQMLAGTVKNLIIDGSISRTDAGYIGGITGYLNGGTIENCVNKALITNSASIGTGGIVGYVGTAGGKITGCINLAKVLSQSSVGGIVGATGVMSETNVSISKCINMGEISGTSNVSGILGTASASQITISDCMNIGEILADNTSEPAYASGITTPTAACSVSSCINVGQVSATSETSAKSGAISIPTNGTYTNNYYDSFVNSSVDDSNTDGISGVSTTELIGSSSNLSLQGITTDNWSFADNRYPLPDIAGNIPVQIWAIVEAAATPESPSASGGGISLNEISSWDELVTIINSLSDDTTPTEFKIMNNLTATSKIDLLCPVKITSNEAVTITRGDSFKDAFFETAVSLEIIGTQTAIITFDGGSTSATEPIIYAYSDLSLEYCNFINNTTNKTDGGALNISSTHVNTINISNCIFTNNSVTGSSMAGGAVAILSTTAISNFKNCTFENNIAQHGGGAIYILGKSENCSEKWTTFEDCTFKDNKSYYSNYDYGGAIYVTSGPVSLNTVHMENNFRYQGDTDTTGTSSDIYLNGYQQELKLNGKITISTLKIKISTNTPKDIGISEFFDTDNSRIENLVLTVETGSVSNVSRPFKIYTYDTVGTNAYSETECTLTNNQINCFNSIYDEQSIYYQLLEDGSIEQK